MRIRIRNINYLFAVLLISLIALVLAHEREILPDGMGISQLSNTTSYTIERFIFLAIGIFSGAYFGKRTGLIVLFIAFAFMLVNALFVDSGRVNAMVQTPLIFLTGIFIIFLFESRRKYYSREMALKEAQSLGRIGSWKYEFKSRKITWSDETYVLFERNTAFGPPSYREVFGYYTPEHANQLKDTARNAIKSGQIRSTDVELVLPSGITAWQHVIMKPEKNVLSNVIKLSGTVQDVTEQKKVDQMKDEFIALISHELRTPITVIFGSLRVVLDGKTSPEETRELLLNAVESTEALHHILENMVELARYQIGKLKLNIVPLDVGQISRKIIGKLNGFGTMQSFLIEIPEDLPQIEADPVRMEIILYNLLENAVKHSPENGVIKIRVMVEKGFCVVRIIDHGSGISKENQERLFELFNVKENNMETDGMGLGLMVCKRLLESHGGWIKVESTVGAGSTFIFGIPVNSEKHHTPYSSVSLVKR